MIKLSNALVLALLTSAISALGEQHGDQSEPRNLPRYDRAMALEATSETSANVAFGDVNGDGNLDLVLAKGRHWPLANRVLIGDGQGGLLRSYDLGTVSDRSYSGRLADLDADGDLDVIVSNDRPDPKLVYLNNGKGIFEVGSEFGRAEWATRNANIADLNHDGLPDIVVANRSGPKGGANYLCINQGGGRFGSDCIAFSDYSTTTITPADFNGDGLIDLAVPHRDGGQSFVYLQTEKTRIDFKKVAFGAPNSSIRMSEVADFDGDGRKDVVAIDTKLGVIIYLQKAADSFSSGISIGSASTRPYALAVSDLNLDGATDIIVGYVNSLSVAYFNRGTGRDFRPVEFGDDKGAVYGFGIGDFNQDGRPDIAAARSGAPNTVYLASGGSESHGDNWPAFRGPGGRGVAEGYPVLGSWNADAKEGKVVGVKWQTPVPGLGHSSPIVFGDRIFLATAISAAGNAPLKIGRGGEPTAADDMGEQSWVIIAYNKMTGEELWRRTASKGQPRASRHAKATHANTSLTTDGRRLVAFFGSEGLYCYDLDGNLLWSRDLGVVNISKYGIGWGYASSPTIYQDRIVLVCDDPENPFMVMLRLSDGEEIWRVSRKGICERSWGTPMIHASDTGTQVVINGWPWVVSYDLATGKELWKIHGGGDNPVPTPFEANGLFYITSAHGGQSPIYVVRPEARGDISPSSNSEAMVWSTQRGGSYLSTPVVYQGYLYLGATNGVVRCFNATTGEKIYQKRLPIGAAIIASLVAADGKIYCASEDGTVYVLAAGPEFKVLARNKMGDPCFATPAISEGVMYFRTTRSLLAIN